MTNSLSLAIILALGVLEAASMSLPMVTPRPQLNASTDEHDMLQQRAITTEMSTCGYADGNPSSIRTANSGYDCRVDTARGLWGFCPTTVISASDCGLAGYCVDTGTCSSGCGAASLSGESTITTFTCTDSDAAYCSTALLTFGVDQTYAYIACAATAMTAHYDITPTTTSTSATTTSDTSSSSNSQSTSSTSSSSSDQSSSPTSAASTSTASAAAGDSGSSEKSVNTGAIVGGVLGGIAIICLCVVAVVYLMRRGRARDSSDTAQPQTPSQPSSPPPSQQFAVQSTDGQEHKPFMGYESNSMNTTRETSFVSELPASAQWPELSELPASHKQPTMLPS